jgi:hypothetical protein
MYMYVTSVFIQLEHEKYLKQNEDFLLLFEQKFCVAFNYRGNIIMCIND